MLQFDEEIYSHWQALTRFNMIFDNLAGAYFMGHPVWVQCCRRSVLSWALFCRGLLPNRATVEYSWTGAGTKGRITR